MSESDSSAAPTTQADHTWTVWRIDDNANVYVVREHLTREEADRMVEEYTARGHKQTYWVEPDR